MIKILGAVCIFSASALTGIFLSENIRRKKERLSDMQKMLSEISVLIRWNALSMHEIADRLSQRKEFSELEFIKRLSENCKHIRCFPQAWEKSVKEDNTLSDDEKKFLIKIGNSLGTTDIQGQLSELEMYMSELETMITDETVRYKVRGKLYRSLGAAFGAMTGILFM